MGTVYEYQSRHRFGLAADMASIPAACRCAGDLYTQTDTKATYVFDGAAWKGPVPPDWVTAAMLKTDSVETLKIKNLNVTAAKAELGFGRYVPRDVTGWDFTQASDPPFVGNIDGNYHVDGLDLSVIVPAGAVAVLLMIAVKDDAVGQSVIFRANATTKSNCIAQSITQVANVWAPYIYAPLNIDANRLVDFNVAAGLDALKMSVMGWFI